MTTTNERVKLDPKETDAGRRLTFDLSRPGRKGVILPPLDVPEAPLPSPDLLRSEVNLPELAQNEIVRYFLALSRLNYSVDTGFYPLGSCTMKYNPKVNEDVARLSGFALAHPHQPAETVQGALALLFELQQALAEITGMDAVGLAPAAGAQGELCGILMIKAYLAERGEEQRSRVLVPDSAHGTNPATAAMCGFEVVTVPSDGEGNTDMAFLERALDDGVAAMMLTLPSTLGLFDPNIGRIAETLHRHGALLYGDGANQNAFLGRARFGDMGFDVVHLNLHKTFSTPHGGGGPGAGPVCAKAKLARYLPGPVVDKEGEHFVFAAPERSIGKTMAFHGNFGVLVRAYTYIRSLGAEGLRAISENAVVNANYVLARLKGAYHLPYGRRCLHEVVFSGSRQRAKGVKTLDIAKRLIDYGFHPPTIYFPLIVDEALMIEPTESESRESLDAFCEAMLAIAREAEESPEVVKGAPYTAPLRRLDEATAARKPVLRWRPAGGKTS
ncbi:MAG: aminomethyl-transferring glycine dehydrogenase subunit GcvPB [Chloroflexi bacterium]|nr:aminomethyl-transferring glycine dehydrogenase subunit GcvPB [Chloroflexota bacterium]